MNVYIFGAGASAAEGAPATQDFFARAWHLLGPDFGPRVQAVWRFLEAVFGVPVTGPDSFRYVPAVDEVISLADWSLQANQGLGYHYDVPRLHAVRRDLEHLLCAALDAALARRSTPGDGPHARFVAGLNGEYALLSLNYDTLLDDALAAAGMEPDYGFRHLCGSRREGPHLAKLHGSLNWAVCSACSHIALTAGNGQPGGLCCTRCGNGHLRGLIISPTFLKSYEGAHLQHVWDMALDCLQQASRLVFVGYSMPAADVAVYHLIRRGLLVGAGRPRPVVEVINHTDPAWSPTERRLHEEAVRSRFTRLFGPHTHFDFSGFHGQV